ncbi:MAG: zinc ribbon domain-containing protein [Bacteroidales bacterium]|jgi:predicted  nucleic acid-binding Zn-ribbon protein
MAKKNITKDQNELQNQTVNTNENVIVYSSSKKEEDTSPDLTIEQKLESLYCLQLIDFKIDEIKTIRGELPLEVQDLEDAVIGLQTRIDNYNVKIDDLKTAISNLNLKIEEANNLIAKYEGQQMNVRNNREYDSLSKEIEYQTLEIQLAEKRINENNVVIERLEHHIETAKKELSQEKEDLKAKKSELDSIIVETEKEEEDLNKKSEKQSEVIEERLLTAYRKIRSNVRNGLAVVSIERDACGGCFNKIPPQRQLDIKMHKKIIVCEACGRILVDDTIANRAKESMDTN